MPAASPDASVKPPQIAKPAKAAIRKDDPKARLTAKNTTQVQALASPAQPEGMTTDGSTESAALEAAANSSELSAAAESTVGQPNATTQPKAAVGEPNAPKLYIEVGSFKDQNWADNAVEKLTELGFHAMVMHKNVLWMQSYRVEVGPYASRGRDGGSAEKPHFAWLQGASRKLIRISAFTEIAAGFLTAFFRPVLLATAIPVFLRIVNEPRHAP